jgi:hypothetical protein
MLNITYSPRRSIAYVSFRTRAPRTSRQRCHSGKNDRPEAILFDCDGVVRSHLAEATIPVAFSNTIGTRCSDFVPCSNFGRRVFRCVAQLVDTEKDGHRVAFNRAFKEKGIPHEWDVATYGRLLAIGGGKERMTAFFNENRDQEPFKSITDEQQRQALVKEIHQLKTKLFQTMIEEGQMPLRPGVQKLVGAKCALENL